MAGSPDSVLFDLGGVIFRYLPERRLARLVQLTGLTGEHIHAAIWASDYDMICERGDLDAAESHREFNRRVGSDLSYEKFRAVMAHAFDPDPDVLGLVDRVAQDHDVALLTNNWAVVEEALVADYPELSAIFHEHLYFTWSLKGRKPDQAIFNTVLGRWGKSPSQVLFVDDSETNVAGGDGAGLATHRFTGAESLERELQRRGLI